MVTEIRTEGASGAGWGGIGGEWGELSGVMEILYVVAGA